MPTARRLNVLFITLDQWRADAWSAVGNPVVRTPHLDALARDGTRFENHFGQCAPCGPSRASILTGLYLMNHRSFLNGTPLDARFTNLALEARAGGYAPALFGYTDTALDPAVLPPDDPRLLSYEQVLPGFDPVCHLPSQRMEPWLAHLRSRGYEVTDDPMDAWSSGRIAAEDDETAFVTDRFLEWLGEQDEQPWFAHLSYLRPHPPWVASPPYDTMYDPADVPPPIAASPEPPHPWLEWKTRQVHPLLAAGPDARNAALATYYGLITEVDTQLGRILEALRQTGHDDHTLLIVGSDHGEQLGDHGLVGKTGWFDPSYRIPLIVRPPDPSRRRGHVVTRFTESVDIMPTILDAMSLPIPPHCDGRSLVPFAFGEEPHGWRDAAYYEYDLRNPAPPGAMETFGLPLDSCSLSVWRTAEHKLVVFPGSSLPPVLIDLERDPDELHNVIESDGRTAARLLKQMLSFQVRSKQRAIIHTKVVPEDLLPPPS